MKKLKKTVKDWFNGLAVDFCDGGIQKLVTRYKCLNLHGDYVEKLFKVWSNDVKYFFEMSFIYFFLITKWSLLSGRPSYFVEEES
jgi:hypothetical protein